MEPNIHAVGATDAVEARGRGCILQDAPSGWELLHTLFARVMVDLDEVRVVVFGENGDVFADVNGFDTGGGQFTVGHERHHGLRADRNLVLVPVVLLFAVRESRALLFLRHRGMDGHRTGAVGVMLEVDDSPVNLVIDGRRLTNPPWRPGPDWRSGSRRKPWRMREWCVEKTSENLHSGKI